MTSSCCDAGCTATTTTTPTPARCRTPRTPSRPHGPLDGPLLDITGWRPQEIEDGVALMTELGRWPGGRALYDPLPGIRAVVPAFGVGTVGTGSLVFVGLDNWTGLGTFSRPAVLLLVWKGLAY